MGLVSSIKVQVVYYNLAKLLWSCCFYFFFRGDSHRGMVVREWDSSVAIIIKMRREGINLRSAGCDSEVSRPKLLDFKAKRAVNNKITIYSQKYSNLMSTHSLPEDAEHIFSTMSTIKSDSRSANFHESRSRHLENSERYTQSSKKDHDTHNQLDQRLLSIIRHEIDNAKSKYETRTKQLLEANARTISELRLTLCEQQKRLAQKERIINGLINQKKCTYNKFNFGGVQGNKKIKLGQYMYLKDRVEDLEIKLKIVLETLNTGDFDTARKLQELEQQLIRHNGAKMAQLRRQLQLITTTLSNKIQLLGKSLDIKSNTQKQAREHVLECINRQIKQFKEQLNHVNQLQWKYENPNIFELQTILRSLAQRIQKASLQNSRRQEYTFEDDDQFFYPHTERIYEANDDYEHFQCDSDEEREKKENKPFNGEWSGCKFSI